MLFEEKMDPRCGYCKRGRALADGQIICPKRGVLPPDANCKSFVYDPLKRVPPRPAVPKVPQLSPEDFQL